MYTYHILNQLKSYAKAERAFHMPGHKGKADFKAKFPVAPLDVTELSYTDNLLLPVGVIARAQAELAQILGAKKSYILTDGSSSGVLSMVYAVSKLGTKIIVPRNSHKSVWNACRLFGLEPVVVQGEYKEGVITPPSPELIEQLVLNDRTIIGMVAVSPDYYGNISPLREYSEILKRNNRYLLVDGAHGAHLAFEQLGQGYAGVYADLWVDGAHKTLPSLTQGAIVSCNNLTLVQAIEEGLSIFRTTSPSFPIMASVEYGVKYLKNNPDYIAAAKLAVTAFKEKCPLKTYPSDDWTKLAIDCSKAGLSSDTVAKILEKKGIYAELSDGRYILFYLSPLVTQGDLNKLSAALNAVLANKKLKKDYKPQSALPPVERTYSFQYAFKQRKELVPLSDAAGRMSAGIVGITPPCTPVIIAGEIITSAEVKILTGAKNVFGTEDGKIWVVAR